MTTARDGGKFIVRISRQRLLRFDQNEFGTPSNHQDAPFRPVSSAHVLAIARPGCPNCQQIRMLLAKLEAGPAGTATRTFECQKCGHTSTIVVSTDPMQSDALGWLASELRPPT